MSILYVEEYSQIGYNKRRQQVLSPLEPAQASQAITYTTSSVQSAAFQKDTCFVRVHTDSDCHIEFGTNPTAVNQTTKRMAADQTEFFAVPQGEAYKVAVIQSS